MIRLFTWGFCIHMDCEQWSLALEPAQFENIYSIICVVMINVDNKQLSRIQQLCFIRKKIVSKCPDISFDPKTNKCNESL